MLRTAKHPILVDLGISTLCIRLNIWDIDWQLYASSSSSSSSCSSCSSSDDDDDDDDGDDDDDDDDGDDMAILISFILGPQYLPPTRLPKGLFLFKFYILQGIVVYDLRKMAEMRKARGDLSRNCGF